jgi:hypothetical protein
MDLNVDWAIILSEEGEDQLEFALDDLKKGKPMPFMVLLLDTHGVGSVEHEAFKLSLEAQKVDALNKISNELNQIKNSNLDIVSELKKIRRGIRS